MIINDALGKLINKETQHKLESFLSKCMPEKVYLSFVYWIYCKKRLNLQNPTTFNEKLQWYKLFYHDPLMTKCADKYLVHEYVRECGLEHILTKQYNVFQSASEIVFEDLPDDCFIKCNHNSAGNLHWRKGQDLPRKEEIRRKFARMLKVNQYDLSKEWAYKDIPPRIICEEYLAAISTDDFIDYNVFCFNGEPKFVMYNKDLCDADGNHSDGRRIVLTPEFEPIGMTTAVEVLGEADYCKPDNFEQIIEYAKILAKPFPHVRVDFFHVNGEIHFGELTFYSGSGFGDYRPEKWQKIIGDWFVLPERRV